MSCIQVLQGTATWLPFIATDVGTGAPRTGVLFNQVDVSFKKSSDSVFSSKVLTGPPTDFRENGNGVYEIQFSASDLNVVGSFIYVVNSNVAISSPALRQFIGQASVESAQNFTPGTIAVDTNIITGNLVDGHGNPLINESVAARIMAAPTIYGSSPNIGGVGTDMVSTRTDQGGFFALELIQGATYDIVIHSVNYRRSLTVPYNTTDILFNIP